MHIGDALAGAVIGELAAAPGRMDRKTRVEQVLRPRRGSRRIERRMLDQPDQFPRAAFGDGLARASIFATAKA